MSLEINHWTALTRFLSDRLLLGRQHRRTLREVAFGRKSFLFAGCHDAAHRTATLYSPLSPAAQHPRLLPGTRYLLVPGPALPEMVALYMYGVPFYPVVVDPLGVSQHGDKARPRAVGRGHRERQDVPWRYRRI